MKPKPILRSNKDTYQWLYEKREAFLRYPADWIIRFHNMYMKEHLPSGRVLDYGCGGGNNSVFFIEKGYDVYGVDVAEESLNLIKINLQSRSLDLKYAEKFQIIPMDLKRLPFEDNLFDFVLSNQVLYYLPSEQRIREVCREFFRVLRPGGLVFFTMLGPRSWYITHLTKRIHDEKVYEVVIDNPDHRLYGLRELIYLVRDEPELRDLFSDFETVTIGYFDQRMFDMTSNFHWIFAGEKAGSKQ